MGDDDDEQDQDQELSTGDVESWRRRYREANRRLREANRLLSERDAQLRDLGPRAEQGAQLTAKIKDLERAHTAEKSAWKLERTFMAAGLTDPEGQELARIAYERLPSEGRPEPAAWLAAARRDPTRHRWLSAYLPEEEAEEEAEEAEERPAKRVARRHPNAGVRGSQDAAGGDRRPTPAEWSAARDAARQGDSTQLDALRGRSGYAPPRRRGGD